MEKIVKSIVERSVRGKIWRKPIVSFCSSDDVERIRRIHCEHASPYEMLSSARSVIVYFIPFSERVVRSNIAGVRPSKLWARAYVATNMLIERINERIKRRLENLGYKTVKIPPTHNFDERTLTSRWSHKHVAYIAGLGTFGIHTMIITEKGCCGRLGSLITEAEFEFGEPMKEELCLYKRGVDCLECVKRCPFGALSLEGLDRRRCYNVLLDNDAYYSNIRQPTDVCGKCCCGVPCDVKAPRQFS